jgi:Protein of unknown function (DUF3592)
MEDLIVGTIGLALTGLVDLAVWALAAYLWLRRRVFLRRAVRVEGRVVDIRITRAGEKGVGHEVYHPVVRFEDELGRSHKVGCTRGGAMWDDMLGTPLDILMLPGRPETALVELDKSNAPKVVALLALGFAVPVVIVLAAFLSAVRSM